MTYNEILSQEKKTQNSNGCHVMFLLQRIIVLGWHRHNDVIDERKMFLSEIIILIYSLKQKYTNKIYVFHFVAYIAVLSQKI